MNYILGITGPEAYIPAAALVKDGNLVAAAEEERFVRIKQARGYSPINAIEFCLKYEGITFDDVDMIGVGWDSPSTHLRKNISFLLTKKPHHIIRFPSVYHTYKKIKIKNEFIEQLNRKVVYNTHHIAHAASAFHVSGFEDANIITMDGSGEVDATMLAVGKRGKGIEVIKRWSYIESVGALYSDFTNYLGFIPLMDEGKVMGLASYGKPIDSEKISGLIKFSEKDYTMDTLCNYKNYIPGIIDYIKRFGKWPDGWRIRKNLIDIFGPPRSKDDKITSKHADVAATIQNIYETTLIKVATALHDETGIRRFCLAGGSALNCVGNGKLLEQDFVDEIFIQPAASDDGTAIGAAYLLYTAEHKSRFKMEHAYWGPEYSNEEVEEVLKKFDFKFDYYDDIEGIVAELLNRGEIVGRFQGRMEIGPRALGNRSILANPTIPEMADEVNIKVKHREPWRPFAPSMLEESAKEYLKNSYPSPFMILSSKVIEEKQKEIPAVVHVDGTTRAQTVTKKTNSRYYRLISEFEKVSGVPVILNTSLNDRGEPIVCSPFDAINTFKKTGLTYLAIENYMVRK